jgi:protein involved in polysaccharide export with SLBB domain
MNATHLLPMLCLALAGCTSLPRGGPPPSGPGQHSFADQRLEQARTVAQQGVPSATPQLDALVGLIARTTPELTLAQLVTTQERLPLRLRPGDTVQFSGVAATRPELEAPAVIGLSGTLELGSSLGSIPAAGLTTTELAARVAKKVEEVYSQQLTSIATQVTAYAARTVNVVGRVRAHVDAAGGASLLTTVFPIVPQTRLSLYDLISQVQGLAADADDTRLALIRRSSTGEAPVQVFHYSYRDLLEAHVQGKEAWLQPDDQVVVPRLPDVFAYGAVQLPGRFPLRAGTTVTSLLLRAGGFSERADEGRILILNGDQERPAQVGEALQPNDVVFIPSSQRVYVVGPGVLRNGPLNLPHHGLSALQAISEAGWFTPLADTGDVQIQRFEDGRRSLIHVPVSDLLSGAARETDYMLRPGDTVYVPEGLW